MTCIMMAAVLTATITAKTVENPVIQSSNTSIIDISGITNTDAATVVDVHATFRPGWWIQIVSDTRLEADGKKYKLMKAEGITLDEHFWMPESGEADFRFFFEPVPESVSTMDFIEGDGEGAFRIWGIDMTGAADPYAVNPDIPKQLVDLQPAFTNMDPVFDVAPTKLKFHYAGYRPEIQDHIECYINSFTGQEEVGEIKLDSNGEGALELTLYGTSELLLPHENAQIGFSTLLAPGENIDIYLDGNAVGRAKMAKRTANKDNYDKLYAVPTVYHSGRYAAYEKAKSAARQEVFKYLPGATYFDHGNCPDFRYDITTNEYMDWLMRTYQANLKAISESDMSEDAKAYAKSSIEAELLAVLAETDYILRYKYWAATGAEYGSDIPEDAIKLHIGKDEWKRVIDAIDDINDARFLNIYVSSGLSSILDGRQPTEFFDALPENAALSQIHQYKALMKKLDDDTFTEDDMQTVCSMDNPFYAKAVETKISEIAAAKEKYSKSQVQPVPEVADSEVFDAIIAPHKGKVVMVDLWNTWCGPCRAAIKATEPLKATELNDDDIVWIYIANESSPTNKYLEMIGNIKGIHYRLNSSQWNAITDSFEVDGIPFYILVDREGKAEGRPDLRDHSAYKKALLDKLH